MPPLGKVLQRIVQARSDSNIRFGDLRCLLRAMGFDERAKGDHHIFWRDAVEEIINLQPHPDGKAKPYQVKQVRQIIARYGLGIRD